MFCENCGQQVSRAGKDLKSYGTTSLMVHLRSKHLESLMKYEERSRGYKEAQKQLSKSKKPFHHQLSLIE